MPEDDRYQHYEVLKRADGSLWELGRGAMGVTYKAYDTNLHCTVALKVINSTYLENETARQRFLREARAAAALRHPNVASVFHLGSDHGTYFYAMEFIDGQTVDEYLKHKGRLTPLEALDVAFQVTRALAAAAQQHLVHRDLKPTNLMVVDVDGEKVVKVIDFGLVKSIRREAADSAPLTEGGSFVGTPHFASPEQLEEGDLDVRSDIYSLGTTLYYLATGHPPFSGSVAQVISQHLYKPVPREPLERLPIPFTNLILSMMEKDREKRSQSAAELRQAIQNCIRALGVTDLSASSSGVIRALQPDPMATAPEAPAPEMVVEAGSILARKYRVDQPLPDHVAGKRYLGFDLDHRLTVSLLVLSREFVSDVTHWSALERAVGLVRQAPHPGLRQLIGLETVGDQAILVEEFLSAPSLREILRARGRLSAAEVVAALEGLAPVADHARLHGLEHVDFTLGGIQLGGPGHGQGAAGFALWIQKPLTEWPELTLRVAPLDFLFQAHDSRRWASEATVVRPSVELFSGPRGSYVRQLSLLAYELLGGPRGTVEVQGRYIPLAALPESGNQVLRRGLVDEVGTAGELAVALAGCLTGRFGAGSGAAVSTAASHAPVASGPAPAAPPDSGERVSAPGTQPPTADNPALPMPEPLGAGTELADRYRLLETLGDRPEGQHFLAEDLRKPGRVSLLVLNRVFALKTEGGAALQDAVNRLEHAPHPMLRAIHSLEMLAGYHVLVQECVTAPSLQEVVRDHGAFSAPEVIRLVSLLAPLTDHASDHRLQFIDLSVGGIHVLGPALTGSEIPADLLQRPFTAWEPLQLKVDAIDFSSLLLPAGTEADAVTRVEGTQGGGPRGSYVRLLSLLAYELLGGARIQLVATGQYAPVAALSEEGNAVLQRALADEWPSGGEFAQQLAASAGDAGPAVFASVNGAAGEVRPVLPKAPGSKSLEERLLRRDGVPRWASALGMLALLGLGGYGFYRVSHHVHSSLNKDRARLAARPLRPPALSAGAPVRSPGPPTDSGSPQPVPRPQDNGPVMVEQAAPSPVQAGLPSGPAVPAPSVPPPGVDLAVASSTPSFAPSPEEPAAQTKPRPEGSDDVKPLAAVPLPTQEASNSKGPEDMAGPDRDAKTMTQDGAQDEDENDAGGPPEAPGANRGPTKPSAASAFVTGKSKAPRRHPYRPRRPARPQPTPTFWQRLFGRKEAKQTKPVNPRH